MSKPILIFVALTLLLLNACVVEQETVPRIADSTEREVLFSVFIPQGGNTRALDSDQETNVSTVDVLAFKYDTDDQKWYYAYHSKGTAVSEGADMYSITARMLTEKQKFVVLTNIATEVAAITDNILSSETTIEKELLLARLQVDLSSGKWDTDAEYRRLPAWGESDEIVIDGTTTKLSDDPISLLRMVARIDVKLSTADVTKTTDIFKLTSVHLYNYQTHGRVVPITDATHYDASGNKALKASIPVVPGTTEPYAPTKGPVEHTEMSTAGTAMEGVIYAFETAAGTSHSTRTCIVIGGKYSSDGDFESAPETYYRVDFSKKVGGQDEFVDILRNHHYRFVVDAVLGEGHESVEVAFMSKSVNLAAELVVWQQNDMGTIIFDGDAMLSVSPEQFTFYRNEARTAMSDDNILEVYTNFEATDETYPSGWYIKSVVEPQTDGATTTYANFNAVGCWLKLYDETDALMPVGKGEGNANLQEPDKKKKMWLQFDAIPETVLRGRSIVITFAAGRLEFPVTITQSNDFLYDIKLSYVVGSEETVLDNGGTLTFASGKGVEPAGKMLKISWMPEDENVEVTATNIGDGFPSGVTIPSNLTSGSYSQMLTPTAIDTETDGRTELLTFTLRGGGRTVVKTLLLRQLEYNLRLEGAESILLMDDTEHALTVKSNVNWQVKILEDKGGILQPLTITEGYANTDRGNGMPIQFNDFIDRYQANTAAFTEMFADAGTAEVTLEFTHIDENGQDILLGRETIKASPILAVPQSDPSASIPVEGGSSVTYDIKSKSGYTWELGAPVVSSDPSPVAGTGESTYLKRKAALTVQNHIAKVTTATGEEISTDATYTSDISMKLKMPPVQFPNRLIPGINGKVQLSLMVDDDPVEIPNAVIEVEQDELMPREMKIWSPFQQYGSITEYADLTYFRDQRNYMLSYWKARYDWTWNSNFTWDAGTATVRAAIAPYINTNRATPGDDFDITYLQIGLGPYSTEFPDITAVTNARQNGEVPIWYAAVEDAYPSTSLAIQYFPGYTASSPEYNLVASDGGEANLSIDTDTKTTSSLVYKFVMGNYTGSPRTVVIPSTGTFFDTTDGVCTMLTDWPDTAIPIARFTTMNNRAAMITIDPTTNVLYMGENTMLGYDEPTPFNSLSYPRHKLFANLVEYITLSAEYGKLFSNLLIGTDESNGADLWDSVWGANIYPN
ncbi:MAG: hypothetical protein LBM62_02080 [Mediterranea sp.]|jgi:hypothetical protein|nr:hypothetical protein [Mediterranea sp.]